VKKTIEPETKMPAKKNENLPEPEMLIHQFLLAMRMRNCSQRTVRHWRFVITRFADWCAQRGIECVSGVTPDIVAAYRRALFHYRNPRTGAPLKFDTQAHYLAPVRRWFAWLTAAGLTNSDPACDVQLPKSEHRLPTSVLPADQIETLLNRADVSTPAGLRDRAILETLYSSGIRCGELVALDVYDVDRQRQVLVVRRGKGGRDRVVPIGLRALSWIDKWLMDVRPDWISQSSAQALFVSLNGRRLGPNYVSNRVKTYLRGAGITARGSCHLLRHSAATLMMENGADLRSLQEFLGHARLNTTQIYTHVSIRRLQEVHRRTHPATPNDRLSAESPADHDR
jgi:integrase/recombinase XerD